MIRPNPLRSGHAASGAAIRLHISDAAAHGPMGLDILDLSGRRLRTLLREAPAAGTSWLQWNGSDDSGRPLGTGVYYLRLNTPDGESGVRVVLVR